MCVCGVGGDAWRILDTGRANHDTRDCFPDPETDPEETEDDNPNVRKRTALGKLAKPKPKSSPVTKAKAATTRYVPGDGVLCCRVCVCVCVCVCVLVCPVIRAQC